MFVLAGAETEMGAGWKHVSSASTSVCLCMCVYLLNYNPAKIVLGFCKRAEISSFKCETLILSEDPSHPIDH